MTPDKNPGATIWPFPRTRRAAGNVLMVAMVGLSATIPARADPPKKVEAFAHKYVPIYTDTGANLTLMVQAPAFKTLIETRANGIPGRTDEGLIGAIHQGAKAVAVGAAAGQSVRFEFGPGGKIVLWVGGQFLVTGLQPAEARPMTSLVETGNNGLVTLTDSTTHNGKRGYRPRVAASYLDTEDGYWLLWADAISETLFYRTGFEQGDFPDGLTIVDSYYPVTISSTDKVEIRGGEPWVAFWRCQQGKRGRIVRYDDFGLAVEPRNENDFRAVETVRRVFKWTPVMRLAAESDPAAYRNFARQLGRVPIAPVSTPRVLIEE